MANEKQTVGETAVGHIGSILRAITVISGLIAGGIVLAIVVLSFFRVEPIPQVLSNWGGVIIGFYFGQSVNLLKDYMSIVQGPLGTTEKTSR